MSDTWNYSDRAERAAARADARRRKASVLGIENDGEYIYVEWVRDNGEKVRGHFKLDGWGRAPAEFTRRTLASLANGPVQMLYPRRAEAAPDLSPNTAVKTPRQ